MLKEAENCSTDYCFPNKLEDILVLIDAQKQDPDGANAFYYLGNLWYDKLQYDQAISCWETAAEKKPGFAITWRNLSLAYYNKRKDPEKAKAALEKAAELAPNDARIFLELDQLYRKLEMPVAERLSRYEKAKEIFMQRDDLMIEYVTLLNLSGHYKEAYDFIISRTGSIRGKAEKERLRPSIRPLSWSSEKRKSQKSTGARQKRSLRSGAGISGEPRGRKAGRNEGQPHPLLSRTCKRASRGERGGEGRV